MKKKLRSGGRLRLRLGSGSARVAASSSSSAWRISTCDFASQSTKSLPNNSAGAHVNVRQAGHEDRFLFLVVPLGEDQIDEFVYPRGFRARRVGLRNDELGDGGDGRVLMGIEVFSTG